MTRYLQVFAFLVSMSLSCWAQSATPEPMANDESRENESALAPATETKTTTDTSKAAVNTVLRLAPVSTVVAKEELALGFSQLACDQDGSIYLGLEGGGGSTSLRKISRQGELLTRFEPYAVSDVEVYGVGNYALSPDDEIYMWVGNAKDNSFYVLSFGSDGRFRKAIKLDPGVSWMPASLAVFRDGNFLVTGQKRKDGAPFTGIFRSDGKLLKEIFPEDDAAIQHPGSEGDPKLTSPSVPGSNRAISWGRAEAGKDGNIYVMRWISPAKFYVVSPGGEVLRRFTVDGGNGSLMPVMMHVSGSRIAVLFRNESTREQLVKIVSLEGEEIATYDASPHGEKIAIGAAFACYDSRHTQFTFLASEADRRIMVRKFEPR